MISDVYFPRINGVSTSIESFRHALAAEGVEVHVVAPAYPHDHEIDTRIVRVPSTQVPLDPEDRLMHWGALGSALERTTAAAAFDLMHIQTPFAAHYAGLRHARRLGIPCIVTYHTHFEEYFYNYVPFAPKSLLRGLARTLARRQCNTLDAVIVPSIAMQETLIAYGVSTPIHRVPTGIPLNQFARPASVDFRDRHGIAEDRLVALYVGRAAHEKNIDFLLNALPHALATCPQALLVVAGEGPALPALQAHAQTLGIADHVRFVGYLDRRTELPACYAAADIFVFASRTETQGLVLLEALATGLPVLAFSELGTREIIEPRRGALPAPQEPESFGACLSRLLNDPGLRRSMGEEARKFASEWSTEACARQLAEVYRSLVH